MKQVTLKKIKETVDSVYSEDGPGYVICVDGVEQVVDEDEYWINDYNGVVIVKKYEHIIGIVSQEEHCGGFYICKGFNESDGDFETFEDMLDHYKNSDITFWIEES